MQRRRSARTNTWEGALSLDTDLLQAVRSTAVAELSWSSADGRPDATPVTPLLLADQPVVAFPYAYEQLARKVAAAPAVALVWSDPRITGSGWRPLAVTGQPQLVDDRDGAIFTEQLLTQELKKYPPARALADSPLLRREHWWYMPRLLLLIDIRSVSTVRARRDPTDLVLTVAPGGPDAALTADTVRIDDPGTIDTRTSPAGRHDEVRVTSLAGRDLSDGAAALLGHDFSVPDLERWTSWVTSGQLTGGILRIDERPAQTSLEPTLTLRQRFRRQRRLERACRRALDARQPQ